MNKRDLEIAWIVKHLAGPLFNQDGFERIRRGDVAPLIPTVYFLTGADDSVLYVGQTQCLALRLKQHERKRKRPIPFTHVEYFVPGIGNKSDRLRLETALLSLIVPRFNTAILLRIIPQSRTVVEIRWRKNAKRRLF